MVPAPSNSAVKPLSPASRSTTSNWRLVYLGWNLFSQIICLVAGILVYQATNSLTVQLNFLGNLCNAVAVLINISAEVVKTQSTSVRTILVVDLTGCALSLMLLLGVATLGIVEAVIRTTGVDEQTQLAHKSEMLLYGSSALALGFVDLGLFLLLKNRMLPQKDQMHDNLNMLSCLLHVIADQFGDFIVVVTSVCLRLATNLEGDTWAMGRQRKAVIDMVGAGFELLFILVLVFWLVQDAMATKHRLQKGDMALREEVPEAIAYGTMDQAS